MDKAASESIRTISKEVMADVGTRLRMDGFTLDPNVMGKTFTVIDVTENEFSGRKTFSVTLKSDDLVIVVSAGILKAARILGVDSLDVKKEDFFKGNENILLRSKASSIWAGSRYFHAEQRIKSDEEWILPEKIHIEYAVLAENPSKPGEPSMNPLLYNGFKTVIDSYQEKGNFPTVQQFEEELKKAGADRIKGLSSDLTEPTPFDYVTEGAVSNYRYNLVFKDVSGKNE